MSFIRTKILKGKPYLFEVNTYRESDKVKQGQKYLGPAKDLTIKQEILRKYIFGYSWSILQELEMWEQMEDCHNIKIPESSNFMYIVALKTAKKLNHFIAQTINDAGWVEEQTVSIGRFYKILSMVEEIRTYAPYCRKLFELIENYKKDITSLINGKSVAQWM